MRLLLLLLLSFNAFAISDESLSERWLGRVKVIDRHEGYQDAETLVAPQGTWQTLFAVVLSSEIHCLHARVPQTKALDGILRVTVVGVKERCAGAWEREPLWEQKELRSIQFSVNENEIRLWWTQGDGRVHSWVSKTPGIQGVFFYPPGVPSDESPKIPLVGDLKDVYPANPCSFAEGTCQLCRYGAYKVPGDDQKFYCGIDRCGEANQPACFRGKRWQRERGPFSCRGNKTHVFCASGLKVECLGEVAFCR